LIRKDGKVIGSELIAQKFTADRYFQARPSAADFATIPSGASNQGPTSASLRAVVDERKARLGVDAPAELLLASASGLDPHLSLKGLMFQLNRVASARGLAANPVARRELEDLIRSRAEGPSLGILGSPRVNVLLLNILLDERFP
jgi:K+-transporting ATPase ATPase C chain